MGQSHYVHMGMTLFHCTGKLVVGVADSLRLEKSKIPRFQIQDGTADEYLSSQMLAALVDRKR